MAYAEIVLAPGSGRPVSLNLSDGNGNPIDFSVGTWVARMVIVPYPRYVGVPFYTLTTPGVVVPSGPSAAWLVLTSQSQLVLNPDATITVTDPWKFTRYHYDCWLQGPNVSSIPDRAGHGPFKMDW